jgi:tetratricopeptide (TPR) repeat protein
LLIIDNADDPNFNYSQYFPTGEIGTIIITSRIPKVKKYATVGSSELEGLEPDEALQLFCKAAGLGPDISPSESRQANRIVVEILHCHTLAILQAGSYINHNFSTLEKYAEILERTKTDETTILRRKRALEFQDPQESSRYGSVYNTFEVSVLALESDRTSQKSQDALDLLNILSMLHFGPLSVFIFSAAWENYNNLRPLPTDSGYKAALTTWHEEHLPGFLILDGDRWDHYRLQQAINLLSSLSLVHQSKGDGHDRLSTHPLINSWATLRQSAEPRGKSWLCAGSIISFSWSEEANRASFIYEMLSHIKSFTAEKASNVFDLGPEKEIIAILLRCAFYIHGAGQDSSLQDLLSHIWKNLGRDPFEPQLEFYQLYELEAFCQINRGHYEAALRNFEKLVSVLETREDREEKQSLHKYQELTARRYMDRGDYQIALNILEDLAETRNKEVTNDLSHPESREFSYSISRAYLFNGMVQKAIDLLEPLVSFEQESLDSDDYYSLVHQTMLGKAYLMDGRHNNAVVILECVMNVQSMRFAEDNFDLLETQQWLASAYREIGQTYNALELFKIVAAVCARRPPSDYRRLSSQIWLAQGCRDVGEKVEAQRIMNDLRPIMRSNHPKYHRVREWYENLVEEWRVEDLELTVAD